MANDDWRRGSPEFNSPNLDRNLALRDALRPIARHHETSVSSVAIAWTLSWPGVTAAIVGARSPEQVDGWIDAAYLELTPDDLDEIAMAIKQTGAGRGPSTPDQKMEELEPTSTARRNFLKESFYRGVFEVVGFCFQTRLIWWKGTSKLVDRGHTQSL
jgi:hypothetical protein